MKIAPITTNFNSNYNIRNKNINFNSKSTNSFKKLTKTEKYLNAVIAGLFIALSLHIKSTVEEIKKDNISVEPLIENFETKEGAINYAIERIVEPLNQKYPKEYMVHINDKNNKIMSECLGKEHSVTELTVGKKLFNTLFVPNFSYTILHGHPVHEEGNTQTFSFQDFKAFTDSKKCSAIYVVNKDGKYCKLEKTKDYKKPSKKELQKILEDFYFSYESSRVRSKIIFDKKGNKVFELTDTPNMHRFWSDTAEKFGIKYSTTFGTYGLYGDIYEDTENYVYALDNKLEMINENFF